MRRAQKRYEAYDNTIFHTALTAFNRRRLNPTYGPTEWKRDLGDAHAWAIREGDFVEVERDAIAERAETAPTDPDRFVAWFENLEKYGPGQRDCLFPWLAEEAPHEAMIWFLQQEIAGEAGFDDLVAMTQVKLPTQAKLELARNYWDEMGQGKPSAMHGPMLSALASELKIVPSAAPVWEAMALGNLMVALAANRRYTFESIGALGVIELTAPGRAELVNEGLKRLGVGGEARRYYALHATLDRKHSAAWNREVLVSIVRENPATARAIAQGALMRLEAGRRCFERYREELKPYMPSSRRAAPHLRAVR